MNIVILKNLIAFLFCQISHFTLVLQRLNKFNNLNQQKGSTKEKKATVYNNASELYNEYLETYFDEYNTLSDAQERELHDKYDPINLFLEIYNYNIWFENEEELIDKKND